MDRYQAIEEQIQSAAGSCALDRVYLPHARTDAGPAAKFGLGAEFYLSHNDPAVLRHRAMGFLADFWNTFPKQVDRLLHLDQGRTTRFAGDPTPLLQADCERQPVPAGYTAELHGHLAIGVPHDDIPPYRAHATIRRDGDPRLHVVEGQFPVGDGAGNTRFGTLLSAVLRWCEICRPAHGSAGYALIFASGMQKNSVYALQAMKRFPGLDFQDAGAFSSLARDVHHRIKCANWLTILGNALIEQLGGLFALGQALHPFCSLHAYSGGAVIQAGASPSMCDRHHEGIPAAYRSVARLTRRVRFDAYPRSLFQVPAALDGLRENQAWMARFD